MSDQVFRMPITGLPAQSSSDQPICKARERWPKERRSAGPNQRVLRRLSGVRVRGSGDLVIGVPSADDQRRSSAPSRRRQRPSGLPSRSASGSSAVGQVLVADRPQEAPDRQRADRGGAAVGGGGVGPAMHHGVAHLDAGGIAVDQDAADLALEHRQQQPRRLEVALVHLDGGGELAFQPLGEAQHRLDVRAADDEGGGAEDLLRAGPGRRGSRRPWSRTAPPRPGCRPWRAGRDATLRTPVVAGQVRRRPSDRP